jgi:hypothetical protein
VEVALGAQWNPGETSDKELSGSGRYFDYSKGSISSLDILKLPHEPTVALDAVGLKIHKEN